MIASIQCKLTSDGMLPRNIFEGIPVLRIGKFRIVCENISLNLYTIFCSQNFNSWRRQNKAIFAFQMGMMSEEAKHKGFRNLRESNTRKNCKKNTMEDVLNTL